MAKREAKRQVSVPLDAAREAVETFDREKQEPSLVLLKIALMIEKHADEEVSPDYTVAQIHALIDGDDVPAWYAGLMMGIAKHIEAAA